MIIIKNRADMILFNPLAEDVNQLFVLSGYATPNMASWYIVNANKYMEDMKINKEIELNILIGMPPFDGLSISTHEGFKELSRKSLPKHFIRFNCSYVTQSPAVHSKLYIWAKDNKPLKSFLGSANFTQSSFGLVREELLIECNPDEAFEYYNIVNSRSIYCTHSEVEEHILLHPSHPILDMENKPSQDLDGTGIRKITLSLLANDGETGSRSGINWGQRQGRNPNQAYIPLPSKVAKTGFFPLNQRHFTVITDDGHILILRVEQQNDKAITTPHSNALIGEYIRNRIGVPNGAYIFKNDLISYGRTDIDFYKLDDEQFYLDFSLK